MGLLGPSESAPVEDDGIVDAGDERDEERDQIDEDDPIEIAELEPLGDEQEGEADEQDPDGNEEAEDRQAEKVAARESLAKRSELEQEVVGAQPDFGAAVEADNEVEGELLAAVEAAQTELEGLLDEIEAESGALKYVPKFQSTLADARNNLNRLAGAGDAEGEVAGQIREAKRLRGLKQYDAAQDQLDAALSAIDTELRKATTPDPLEASFNDETTANMLEFREAVQRWRRSLAVTFGRRTVTLEAVSTAQETAVAEVEDEEPPGDDEDADAETPEAPEVLSADLDIALTPVLESIATIEAAIDDLPMPWNWFWAMSGRKQAAVDQKEAAKQALSYVKGNFEMGMGTVQAELQKTPPDYQTAAIAYQAAIEQAIAGLEPVGQAVAESKDPDSVNQAITSALTQLSQDPSILRFDQSLGAAAQRQAEEAAAEAQRQAEEAAAEAQRQSEEAAAGADDAAGDAGVEEVTPPLPDKLETKEDFKRAVGQLVYNFQEAMAEPNAKKKMAKMLGVAFQALGLLMAGMSGGNILMFGEAVSEAMGELDVALDPAKLNVNSILDELKLPGLLEVMGRVTIGQLYQYQLNPEDEATRAALIEGGLEESDLEHLDNLRNSTDTGPAFVQSMEQIFTTEGVVEYATSSETQGHSLSRFMNNKLTELAASIMPGSPAE